MLQVDRLYRLWSLEERNFTYRIRALWPTRAPVDCYATLSDDRGTVARIDSIHGASTGEMDSKEALADTGPRVGTWLLTLSIRIPRETAHPAGFVDFSILGQDFRVALRNGFPIPCYVPRQPHVIPPPPPPPPDLPTPEPPFVPDVGEYLRNLDPLFPFNIRSTNLLSRIEAAFHGEVIRQLYTNVNVAQRLVRYWAPEGEMFAIPVDARNGSGCLVLRHPTGTFVWICGVTTRLQGEKITAGYIEGPVNYGQYGANREYYIGQTPALDIMRGADIDAKLPIQLMGHSMGGAIATILAIRMRLTHPDRFINCLTFAAPKAVNIQGERILARTNIVQLQNDGDPVPQTPPTSIEADRLGLNFNEIIFRRLDLYRRPVGGILIDRDGTLRPRQVYLLTNEDITANINALRRGEPTPAVMNHSIGEYVRRLLLNPP